MVYIPDDSDFSSFRDQCESLEGWHCRYNKAGVTVWSQGQEESCTVQKIKVRRRFPAPAVCPRVSGDCPVLDMHSPACLGVFLPRIPGLDPPKGASLLPAPGFTCRDPAASCPAGSGGACPHPDTVGKPRDRLHCGDALPEPPDTQRRPWCPVPGSAILGHIPTG